MQEQQRAVALAHIEQVEAELDDALNTWRRDLVLVEPGAFRSMLAIAPFVNTLTPPANPDFETARQVCDTNAVATVRREQPIRGWRRVAWLSGVPVASLIALVVGPLWVLAGVVAAVIAQYLATSSWKRELAPQCRERASSEWLTIRADLQAKHEEAAAAFEAETRAAEQAWLAQEKERVEVVQRLIRGEAEAVHASVSAALEALDFPFETECEVVVDDEDHVMIDVDLPEIEDVIPETQLKVLKDGSLKESKRKVSDRNLAYSELVCGLALAVAAAALSAAPTVAQVTVAGRTQRQKRGGAGVDDVYVFDAKLPRELCSALKPDGVSPIDILERLPSSRIQRMSNGSLKKIPAPDWRR